jgi:15-cis-phytoene synthase
VTLECREIVRELDKDRYLATLFASEVTQPSLFAVYAFKCEIERIPLLVSEPQIGEIRLQWWIDTLHGMDTGEPIGHPVAEALRACVAAHRLPINSLVKLVEAHQFDLYADRMPSLNDLEGYLGETESCLFQLGRLIVDPTAAQNAAEFAGLAGVAFGLARLCNRISDGDKFIPPSHSLSDLKSHAAQRLAELRRLEVSKTVLPVFLPVSLCDLYLKATGPVPQWKRQWRLWRAAQSERL